MSGTFRSGINPHPVVMVEQLIMCYVVIRACKSCSI